MPFVLSNVRARAMHSVTVDALHLTRSGGSAQEVGRLGTGQVSHIHLCDGPSEVPAEGYAYEGARERLLPGDGVLPLRSLVDAVGTDVPLGIEAPSVRRCAEGVSDDDYAASAIARAAVVAARRLTGPPVPSLPTTAPFVRPTTRCSCLPTTGSAEPRSRRTAARPSKSRGRGEGEQLVARNRLESDSGRARYDRVGVVEAAHAGGHVARHPHGHPDSRGGGGELAMVLLAVPAVSARPATNGLKQGREITDVIDPVTSRVRRAVDLEQPGQVRDQVHGRHEVTSMTRCQFTARCKGWSKLTNVPMAHRLAAGLK